MIRSPVLAVARSRGIHPEQSNLQWRLTDNNIYLRLLIIRYLARIYAA